MSQINQYSADGSRTTFAYTFPAFELSDIQVQVNGVTVFTGYTVYGLGGGNGGAVEFAAPPASGVIVTFTRVKVPAQVAYLVKDENLADLADKAVARTNLGVYSTTQADAAIATATSAVSDSALLKAQNLADLADKAVSRTNLGVYSTVQTDAAISTAASAVSGSALQKSQNLADLADKAVSRTNLGVYSTVQTDAAISTAASAVSGSALQKAQNLADLADKAVARTNLGVYSTVQTDAAIATAASAVSGSALQKSQNLADLADKAVSRTNLGVYSTTQTDAAIATAASAVSGSALQKSQNLADLADKAVARTNLGLSTVAHTGSYPDLLDKPILGSAAALNVGTGANAVVQLDAYGRLPAVDGSLLTNIFASTSGQVQLDRHAVTNMRLLLNSSVASSALPEGAQWKFAVDEWGSGNTGANYTFFNDAGLTKATNGTPIGSMTSGGGLAAAFDGVIGNQAMTASGAGWVGQDWWAGGPSKTIEKIVFKASASVTYSGNNGGGVTAVLRGSNAAPSVGLEGAVLWSGTLPNAISDVTTISSGIDVSTAYRYHWVYITPPAGGQVVLAELEFWERPISVSGAPDYYTNLMAETTEDGSLTPNTYFNVSRTFIDRSWAVDNSKIVSRVAIYNVQPTGGVCTVKIVKENSTTNHTVVASESFVFAGTGWQTFTLSTPYAVSASGTYRAAVYMPVVNFSVTSANVDYAYYGGDMTGTQTTTLLSGNMPGIRVTYRGATNTMTMTNPVPVTVSSAPARLTAYFLWKDDSGSAVLGTDMAVDLSRDGGTSWTVATLSKVVDYDATYSVIKATANCSGQPVGTSLKLRITALDTKIQRVAAPALYAD